jgi:hypothetical protein
MQPVAVTHTILHNFWGRPTQTLLRTHLQVRCDGAAVKQHFTGQAAVLKSHCCRRPAQTDAQFTTEASGCRQPHETYHKLKLLLQILLLLLVLKAYPSISDAQVHGLQPARTICILRSTYCHTQLNRSQAQPAPTYPPV